MKNNIVFLTSNVQDIRKFVLSNTQIYDFSPSIQIPLSIKKFEGIIQVGNDRQKLYRLSGGMIKTSNGNYIDIDEVLIPESALIKTVKVKINVRRSAILQEPGPCPTLDNIPHAHN